MSEYVQLLKNIETDIYIMESLISDMEYYRQVFQTETEDPQKTVVNQENLEFAIQQYDEHTKLMHPLMERWIEETRHKEERPINLHFFRVLKYLREKKKMGI